MHQHQGWRSTHRPPETEEGGAGGDLGEREWVRGIARDWEHVGRGAASVASGEVEHVSWPVSQCRGGRILAGRWGQLAGDVQQIRIRVS